MLTLEINPTLAAVVQFKRSVAAMASTEVLASTARTLLLDRHTNTLSRNHGLG
jgi:hypothetical protein